ncbi:MAG: HypC/HybG/HupF family hydrogenase formation chaperone [Elusimicrobiota bacterium]|nr:HypC/HybG/HupF family hydrogenase formation chaperone [Elusimicrobiota bacterium]
MCLAVPGKIISFKKNIAEVDFNGARKEVSIDLVPEAKKNDYVLVHAGFAISVLSDKEAKETLDIFSELYNMTPSSLLSGHDEHGKFVKQTSSAKMSKHNKRGGGVKEANK